MIKNKVDNFRRWNHVLPHSQEIDFQFLVMTYNILSQVALKNLENLYKHCSSGFLQEDYRISKILSEILRSNSDIICLQEVEQHIFANQIKQFFSVNGFKSIFKQRPGEKTDGCAILWREKKFNLVKSLEIEFTGKNHKYLTKDNVALIVVLKPNHPKHENTPIFVATTHLLYNPNRGEIKLCQLRLLFAELERLALKEVTENNRFYHPIILCGDFNIEPFSPLYKFIESGFINMANIKTGELSGQKEVKGKGFSIKRKTLSLLKLGINDSSCFEDSRMPNNSWVECTTSSNTNFDTSLSKDKKMLDSKPIALCQQNLIPEISCAISSDLNSLRTLDTEAKTSHTHDMITQIKRDESIQDYSKLKSNKISVSNNYASNNMCFTHELKFVPVYKYNVSDLKKMPITSMCEDFKSVDHIFFNVREKCSETSYLEEQLYLLGSYSLMYAEEIKDIGGLPNAHLGSDHINLIAKFGLK